MSAATQRLFFALWPDAATRSALDQAGADLHAAWGGRRMRADSLHLTLAFLGATPAAQIDAAHEAAASIQLAAFDLSLDRYACWQHNRIGWFGLSQTPHALTQLADALRSAVRARGLNVDEQAFTPHVTLLRNTHCGMAPHNTHGGMAPHNTHGGAVPDALPAVLPAAWPVRDFALLASPGANAGAGYRVLARWRLAQACV